MFIPAASSDLTPTTLAYTGALCGIKPREAGESFTYATIIQTEEEKTNLLCLAASNPEGKFTALGLSISDAKKFMDTARARNVKNIETRPFDINAPLQDIAPFDFVVATIDQDPDKQDKLLEKADMLIKDGGIFVASYRAYEKEEDILTFLAQEFSPEMDRKNALEFLDEIQSLNPSYFKKNAPLLEKITEAQTEQDPDLFLKTLTNTPPVRCETIEIMTGLLKRGFAFGGDSTPSTNIPDLAFSPKALAILEKCTNHVLFEPLKDFALMRLNRADVWVKLPAELSDNPVRLFGNFTFGTTLPREDIPASISMPSKKIDLKKAPYITILDLVATLPASIGDFLSHPTAKGITPEEALTAFQTLTACRMIKPMRSRCQTTNKARMENPEWALAYNRYLDQHTIDQASITLASEVVGASFVLPLRDALVLQAINRVGLSMAGKEVLKELNRLKDQPKLAAHIMDTAEPTEELASMMVVDVINKSLIRWYAYGVLAA